MEGSLVLVLCVLSFVLGFLLVSLYVSFHQAQYVRRKWTVCSPQWSQVGCPKVLELAGTSSPCVLQFDENLTGVKAIDTELEKLLSLGLRDFFEIWYHKRISPDPICAQQALEILHHVIKELTCRSKEVDYLGFFIETLMDDFMDHLKLYKQAVGEATQDGVSTCSSQVVLNETIEREFFKVESSDDPWRAVCSSREDMIVYLHRLSELLLCILLPSEDFASPVLQILLTDVAVQKTWLPLLDTLTQPDNINSTFLSMCKESSLNSDSFMAALESSNEREIRSLRYIISSLVAHLRKTGVTDDDQQKKSVLESVLATAGQLLASNSIPADLPSSSMVSLSTTIPKFTIQTEGTSKHCLFHIQVECRHSHASIVEEWIILRRYRDFHDLHLTLRGNVENFPTSLTLPSLPSFNKFERQRLEVRRQMLESYLNSITSDKFLSEHISALGHVITFLAQGEYTRSSTELERMADTLFGPLRRTANLTRDAIKSSSSNPNTSSPRLSAKVLLPTVLTKKQSSFESNRPPAEEDEDSLPVDIMLILLDELFDIRDGSQWLRRQLPMLLKQLAGDKISRKVVGFSDWFISPEQVASYLSDYRTMMWPSGRLATSVPKTNGEAKELRSLLARAKLIGSIPDDLRRFIGTDTTVKGMTRLFGMFQNKSLNTRLVLLLLEGFLETLFPNRNLKQTFRKIRAEISSQRTIS